MIIDVSTTSSCNYGCRYCSEGLCSEEEAKARLPNSKSKVSTSSIQLLVNQVKAERPDERFTIGFWGGEPLMNFKFCKEVMDAFADDKNVTFLYYTNGYFIERYLDDLKHYLKVIGKERLLMQVSYDGRAINDLVRVTKHGEPTSDTCLRAWRLLKDNGFEVKFKSTLPIEHADKMFECFKEFVELGESYFPTPDIAHWYDEGRIDDYAAALHDNLTKIAQYIYEHGLSPSQFKWFTNSKAKCAAGCGYIALDVDGMVVPCHSAMFTGEDHYWGNIHDINIWDACKSKFKEYEVMREMINTGQHCSSCDALYCMSCPAHTYDLISTGSYEDRWSARNPNMCLVFKISDQVHKALLSALRRKHDLQREDGGSTQKCACEDNKSECSCKRDGT